MPTRYKEGNHDPGHGESPQTIQRILDLPIFPREMVLAVWLIVKGFNPPAVALGAAGTATHELLSAA